MQSRSWGDRKQSASVSVEPTECYETKLKESEEAIRGLKEVEKIKEAQAYE